MSVGGMLVDAAVQIALALLPEIREAIDQGQSDREMQVKLAVKLRRKAIEMMHDEIVGTLGKH